MTVRDEPLCQPTSAVIEDKRGDRQVRKAVSAELGSGFPVAILFRKAKRIG